jgi:hypothetical protein
LNSSPTYYTYINDEDIIEVSFLSYGQEVEQKVDNHVFSKSPKCEISQWGLLKVNYVDFFGLKFFCQIFLKKILTFILACWKKKKIIFHGQERIENFWKKNITESEFITINQELVKIISSQIGASNF